MTLNQELSNDLRLFEFVIKGNDLKRKEELNRTIRAEICWMREYNPKISAKYARMYNKIKENYICQ